MGAYYSLNAREGILFIDGAYPASGSYIDISSLNAREGILFIDSINPQGDEAMNLEELVLMPARAF